MLHNQDSLLVQAVFPSEASSLTKVNSVAMLACWHELRCHAAFQRQNMPGACGAAEKKKKKKKTNHQTKSVYEEEECGGDSLSWARGRPLGCQLSVFPYLLSWSKYRTGGHTG